MGLLDSLRRNLQGSARTKTAVDLPFTYAVLDVETTGLYPRRDRIVEIAVVVTDSLGNILDEWTTLVNPETGRAGPTHIHGIRDEWLGSAPTFADIVGDLSNRIVGRILTAHNSSFDLGFLENELRRAGIDMRERLVVADTMKLVEGFGLPKKLERACDALGISYNAHAAVEDARATAQLLTTLLPRLHKSSVVSLSTVSSTWISPVPSPSGLVHRRAAAVEATRPRDFLSDLAYSIATAAPPPDGATPVAQYRDLLVSALGDGVVTSVEASQLLEVARDLGMSPEVARTVHQEVFLAMLDSALADWVVNNDERNELQVAAGWLGVDISDWNGLVAASRKRVREAQEAFKASLSGKTVTFTGQGIHPRNVREGLCAKNGIVFKSTVGSQTHLVVIGGPRTENATVQKARGLGIPVMLEVDFWKSLGE